MPRLKNKRKEFIRLECVEGNHNKFWQYSQVGENYVASWGKIDALRPQGNKIYSEEEIKKLLKQKLAKGYHVVEE